MRLWAGARGSFWTSLSSGCGLAWLFDVDVHCRKLEAFVAKHRTEAEIFSEALLPCANPEAEKRPVYYGRQIDPVLGSGSKVAS